MKKRNVKVKLDMSFDEAMKRLVKVKFKSLKSKSKISNISSNKPKKSK